MSYTYDPKNNILFHEKTELLLDGLEQNFIGACSKCNADVFSVSYHTYDEQTAVAARCTSCKQMYAIIYDARWNWVSEHSIDLNGSNGAPGQGASLLATFGEGQEGFNDDLKALHAIPKKKLETVFTPAEIVAMFAKAAGKKYVRQYLYRARKKYGDFHELFDIYLDI
ncbi:MAG: hypothetical protein SCH66_12655 [Methanolobus sp.]|nr:hypothetical protein [Methanolobus sp.]